MPFPNTPSMTSSNTPTPSITASNTPTITPTQTNCPYICCLSTDGATSSYLTRLGIRTNGEIAILGNNFTSYAGNPTPKDNVLISNCGEFITTFPKSGFTSNCGNGFGALKVQQDQKIVMVNSPSVQRYKKDNTIDTTWNVGRIFPTNQPICADGYDMDISTLDGSMLFGITTMTSYTNTTATYTGLTGLLRLNANGEVIPGFSGRCVSANARMTPRYDAALDKWYIAGILSYDGSSSRNGIVRVNNDGSLDTTFNFYNSSSYFPTGSYGISTIELQADGKIVCGTDNPAARYVFRLNTDGSLDTSFTLDLSGANETNALHIQQSGKIIVCYANNGKVIRYNTDGSVDPTWNIGTATLFGFEFDINEDSGGNIWIVGQFSQYNGINVDKMIKLDEDGNLLYCAEPTPTNTASMTQTPSKTPTNTPTPSQTATLGLTPTMTQTQTASQTPSSTQTATPSLTPTMTQTQTQTQTMTPSPSFCSNPQAYTIFDANSDRLNLSSWMTSQGSSWKGFNSVPAAPSTTQSIFEAQMNAYISYTGFTVGNNNALMAEPVSSNEDPIIITNSNVWSSNNTWVSIITPVCPLCPEGKYDYISDGSTNYTASNVYKNMIFYYSGTAIANGYYRFYTTYSGTGMRRTNYDNYYNVNTLVCPTATPTPTPTITPTNTSTQTITPTNTATPTKTPTMTPTSNPNAQIDITNGSLDIQVSSVYVNGVNSSLIGGVLPNTTGNGTTLSTNQLGTYTVDVNYSTLIPGQHITLTDSDLNVYCQNVSYGSNTMTFTGIVVASYHNVLIDAQDGTC